MSIFIDKILYFEYLTKKNRCIENLHIVKWNFMKPNYE